MTCQLDRQPSVEDQRRVRPGFHRAPQTFFSNRDKIQSKLHVLCLCVCVMSVRDRECMEKQPALAGISRKNVGVRPCLWEEKATVKHGHEMMQNVVVFFASEKACARVSEH